MAVPKQRSSKSRKRRRHGQWKKRRRPPYVECPQCHDWKRPHHVCLNCGYYRGRQVTEPEE